MELIGIVGLVALLVAAIIAASWLARPARRQAADLAARSNKPDSDNALGPEARRAKR